MILFSWIFCLLAAEALVTQLREGSRLYQEKLEDELKRRDKELAELEAYVRNEMQKQIQKSEETQKKLKDELKQRNQQIAELGAILIAEEAELARSASKSKKISASF